MLAQIVHRFLEKLVREQQLLLAEGTDVQSLSLDIVQEMPNASFGSHFGSWLATQLVSHPQVEELFASDQELNDALKDLGGE